MIKETIPEFISDRDERGKILLLDLTHNLKRKGMSLRRNSCAKGS